MIKGYQDVNNPVRIEFADGAIGNPHPVLRVGDIYSNKYGKITIDEKFLRDIVQNWKDNALQVEPFIDVMHERVESYGTIANLEYNEQTQELYLTPAFTDAGRQLVKDGKYMYFSVDIGAALNSADGSKKYPVLFGVALCNFPVYKEQPRIAAADIGGNMDELKTALDALMGVLNSLDETQKAEAMTAIIETLGITPEIETGDKNKDKEPVKMTDEVKSEILKLSDSLKLAEKENKEMKEKLFRIEFNEKWVGEGKKLAPAQADLYFALLMADKDTTEKILDAMPALELGEKGSAQGETNDLSETDRLIMSERKLDPNNPEHVLKYKNLTK